MPAEFAQVQGGASRRLPHYKDALLPRREASLMLRQDRLATLAPRPAHGSCAAVEARLQEGSTRRPAVVPTAQRQIAMRWLDTHIHGAFGPIVAPARSCWPSERGEYLRQELCCGSGDADRPEWLERGNRFLHELCVRLRPPSHWQPQTEGQSRSCAYRGGVGFSVARLWMWRTADLTGGDSQEGDELRPAHPHPRLHQLQKGIAHMAQLFALAEAVPAPTWWPTPSAPHVGLLH